MSIPSLFTLFQPCQACFGHFTWMIWGIGATWSYSRALLPRFVQNSMQQHLYTICIYFFFPSITLKSKWWSHTVIPTWKNSCFISSERSDFHIIIYSSITVHLSLMLSRLSGKNYRHWWKIELQHADFLFQFTQD